MLVRFTALKLNYKTSRKTKINLTLLRINEMALRASLIVVDCGSQWSRNEKIV